MTKETPAYFDAEKYNQFCAANQDDPYGAAGIQIVDAWAADAENRIANGSSEQDAFGPASDVGSEACGGATGFMMGMAASILGQIWTRGPAFRLWWNLEHAHSDEQREQLRKAADEGRTVNPAIIHVG